MKQVSKRSGELRICGIKWDKIGAVTLTRISACLLVSH
jgi:hypothetical protein